MHSKLAPLEPLIGEWNMEAVVEGETVMRGSSTFAWSDQGEFLVQTADGEATTDLWEGHLPFPTVAITGADDTLGSYSVLYSDARDVVRIYEMSVDGRVIKQWRHAPEFHQRFTATIGDDGSRIDARWERSEDGEEWALDFELTYTRVS
jgi:hypothetical protein